MHRRLRRCADGFFRFGGSQGAATAGACSKRRAPPQSRDQAARREIRQGGPHVDCNSDGCAAFAHTGPCRSVSAACSRRPAFFARPASRRRRGGGATRGCRRVGIVWQTQRHGTKLTDRSLVTATVFRVAPGTSDRRSGPGYGLGNRAGFAREFAATGRFGSTVDSGFDSPDISRIDSGLDSATRRFRGRSQGQVCCGCGSAKSGKRTRHSPPWDQQRNCSVEADGPATTGRCRHGGERRSAGGRGVQGTSCGGAHNRGPITEGHSSTASSVGKTFCREAN
jgi:hypothetical protein